MGDGQTTTDFTTTGEGQVEVAMYPGGGFLIRETHDASLRTVFSDTPFAGASSGRFYSPAGTLPGTLGGMPFDADQDGVLEEDEPFRLQDRKSVV